MIFFKQEMCLKVRFQGIDFLLKGPCKNYSFRYIIKKVATSMNLKEIFDFYEKQQRKLKKIKRGRAYEKRTALS